MKHVASEFTDALKMADDLGEQVLGFCSIPRAARQVSCSLGSLEASVLALLEAHRIDPDLRMQSLADPAFEAIYGADCSPDEAN